MNKKPLLSINNLEIKFKINKHTITAVKDASFNIYPRQKVAIVGESGSGKSTLALAIIKLLANNASISNGEIKFDDIDIIAANEQLMQKVRGKMIGYIPQDPMTNLNPVWNINFQIKEAINSNQNLKKIEINNLIDSLLLTSGIDEPKKRKKQYPHEFSGGMKQRVLISIALACNPKLLIADEPTSALDVTVQKKILDYIDEIVLKKDITFLFITHDLALAAQRADYLIVMHRGEIVESGSSLEILKNPLHPYTKRLLEVVPTMKSDNLYSLRKEKSHNKEEIIKVENLTKIYRVGSFLKKQNFYAVDNVSFVINKGETLGIVGESGSGKSTIANIVLGLLKPTKGTIYYNNLDISKFNRKEQFNFRRKVQVVFQNTSSSLNPLFSIFNSIREPLALHKVGSREEQYNRVLALLELVSLPKDILNRYPNELSGGQRQRVVIARALALKPEIIILDEAVSALDVLVQEQIINLLIKLQNKFSLTYLFISHDLAVVKNIADNTMVMKMGKIVEYDTTEKIFNHPKTEYTKELILASP